MLNQTTLAKKWIKSGIICGLLVSIIYPALIFLPLPEIVQTFLIMLFGPLLALASAGLYYFITIHKRSLTVAAALVSNIIAGALITTMFISVWMLCGMFIFSSGLFSLQLVCSDIRSLVK